jgi:hypothetical protein
MALDDVTNTFDITITVDAELGTPWTGLAAVDPVPDASVRTFASATVGRWIRRMHCSIPKP